MKTVAEYIQLVNKEMEDRFCVSVPEPRQLYEPIQYILSNGGKRIRAVMVLLSSNVFSDDISDAIAPALGVEMFHNFTLLHDDIMDKASIRRGLPTVHLKWDENTAILSGDAMMILANKLICQTNSKNLKQILDTFNQTALEVCEGQQLDMNLEKRDLLTDTISEVEYLEMIRLKTSVLLGASLKIGALCGDAAIEQADTLYQYGINIGLAFQIQDDFLDTFGDEAEFGKRIGGDIIEGKKTYLLIKALESASTNDTATIKDTINNRSIDEGEKIGVIKSLYLKYKVDEQAHDAISHYFSEAQRTLASLDAPEERKANIAQLEQLLRKRSK